MAQMSFRINDATKKDFEKVCEELGLNPTTALTIFIKKTIRECRIPFEVSMYNSETLRVLDESRQNMNLSKTFNNVEELFEDLNSED
ncbi:MAG: type II toxin-antitoxin system RelB/DinJ family antitoxin [Erysipelotrichaceae bacterium]|nr:type II toxin-antitoxin system RelB/DinJ family antitoxin [Erysipelotrichaceae bacterium]